MIKKILNTCKSVLESQTKPVWRLDLFHRLLFCDL